MGFQKWVFRMLSTDSNNKGFIFVMKNGRLHVCSFSVSADDKIIIPPK